MFIALTGGIGCGKSAALAAFANCGFTIADADRICHGFYHTTEGARLVLERWPSVDDGSGGIDRKKLGNIVFRDENDLKWLENLIAPYLFEELEKLRNRPEITVVEIPLLFEKNLQHLCDKIICIWSPFALRRSRLARRGWDHAECSRRERMQWDPDKKLAAADYGIINTGSMEELEAQVKLIARKLQTIQKTQ
ncbi:MAG: dephospho-CoA kinase [Lentisphaeria bacterium]|nr:dephospho-CoA kinase [Lentisphaeria bacterium]MBR7145521.1 dephospho-CoA kinase [Lentisphaeria bacterium]